MLNITNYQRNANQNYSEVSPHQSEWPSLKSLQIINAGEGVKKKEPSYTVGGNVNWCSSYGKQHGGSLKKLKKVQPYDPAILLPGINPKALIQITILNRYLYLHVCCSITKTWKQTKCPLTNEQIKENVGCTHTHTHTLSLSLSLSPPLSQEYYSAIKKKEFCHL